MEQPGIDSKSRESCILDAIEQFVCEKRKLLQDKDDLDCQIKDGLKPHGRSWKPLYELFMPLQLFPIAHFEQLLQERLKKDLVRSKDDKNTYGGIHDT